MYCEIWKRITKQKENFRDALDEVYKLNNYPLRKRRMQYTLEVDSSLIEKYYTCTANLTEEVGEDEAREFILEALKKLVLQWMNLGVIRLADCGIIDLEDEVIFLHEIELSN